MNPDPHPEEQSDWTDDDIELAYQKALEAFDESTDPSIVDAVETGGSSGATDAHVGTTIAPSSEESANVAEQETVVPEVLTNSSVGGELRFHAEHPEVSQSTEIAVSPVTEVPRKRPGTAASKQPGPATPAQPLADPTITPIQVIEAALFVGGHPLTAGKLYALLRGTIDVEQVPGLVDQLNSLYSAQGRPYEIRLGDGGYRLELKPEFERLKMRVFGQGPREVKLAQDALEVLALVAYRQPISQAEVEGHGKAAPGNLLRQLLRRDLVQIERGEQGPRDVRYRTTPRFLSVFGLASLAELPHPEDLAAR